jgi:hypothetical protein
MDSKTLIQKFEGELLSAEQILSTEFSFELAEPNYQRCLAYIQSAPDLQPEFERRALELFESKQVSDEPIAYLMHVLRWPGVRSHLEQGLRKMAHPIATGAPYEKVLSAYEDAWENKDFYSQL